MYYTFSPQQLSAFLGLIAVPNGRYHTASLIYLSTEETSLSMWMQQALEKHHQSTHLWKGFLGSQQKPRLGREKRAGEPKFSLGLLTQALVGSCVLCLCVFKYGSSRSEMEQLLCTCSGFIYLGMEPFVTTIPPDKIAALNMSGIVWTYMVLSCMISGNVLCLCDMIFCIKQSSCAVVSRLRSCVPVICAFVMLWLWCYVPLFTFRVVMCFDSTTYFRFFNFLSIFWAHLSHIWFGWLVGIKVRDIWQTVPEIFLAELHLQLTWEVFEEAPVGVPLKTLLVCCLFCSRIITNLCGSSLWIMVTRFDLIFL